MNINSFFDQVKKGRFSLPEFINKEQYLFFLFNNLGYTDLEICISEIHGDKMVFSKWIKYGYLLTIDYNDWVKGTYKKECARPYTKKEFIKESSHRSVLDIELMFDKGAMKCFGGRREKSEMLRRNRRSKRLKAHCGGTWFDKVS